MLIKQKLDCNGGFFTYNIRFLKHLNHLPLNKGTKRNKKKIHECREMGAEVELCRWTYDQGVKGSVTSYGQFFTPHCLCPTSSNRYLVEQEIIIVAGIPVAFTLCSMALYSPRGDELGP